MIPPYPLAWPKGQKKTASRVKSQFRTSRSGAIKNVKESIRKFAEDSRQKPGQIVVTSNVGGLSDDTPKDTGVAVWFVWDGEQRCIAVDRYLKVEENLQAIHHVIEARRTELRHAGIEMVRTTFRGLTALPPPPPGNGAIEIAPWWKILGVAQTASRDEISTAYKAKARGAVSEAEKRALNVARDEGMSQ